MSGFGSFHVVDKNAPKAPPEGVLPVPPENEQYVFQDKFEYTNTLAEEAELVDPFSMTPDVDTHTDPAMAARHLGTILTGIAVFGIFVYVFAPLKPTTVRDLPWTQVDKDYGGHLGFATGKSTKEFRD